MRLNKKVNIILIIGLIILLAGIFVINNQHKETKELPRVKLKEPSKNKQFALMLEQNKGKQDYQESNDELPTEGYKFNKEKSGCVDINGKVVEDALDYDYSSYTVLLDTSKTLYCYLYYDIADFKVYASLDTAYVNFYGEKYRSKEYRDKIVSVSFVSRVPSAEELKLLTYWDLSDTTKGTKENSVIGWLEETENGTDQYNLYIGSKGSIYAIDLSYVFHGMNNLQEINFDNLNTNETINMSSMFDGCSSLTILDLSSFDTSEVTDMSDMFDSVTSELPFKDWPNFVTTNVENMSGMFSEYQGTTLDLSTFDTSKVTDMNYMFAGYQGFELDLSMFDTSKVTDMSMMFAEAYTPEIFFSNNFGSAATSMSGMFFEYEGDILDLSNFDTSSVTDMGGMFSFMSISVELPFQDWPNFVTTNVESMREMFSNYQGTELDLSNFDTSKVTNMNAMFAGCYSLTILDLSNFTFDAIDSLFVSAAFDYVPSECVVTLKRSQQEIFESKFSYDFTPSYVD